MVHFPARDVWLPEGIPIRWKPCLCWFIAGPCSSRLGGSTYRWQAAAFNLDQRWVFPKGNLTGFLQRTILSSWNSFPSIFTMPAMIHDHPSSFHVYLSHLQSYYATFFGWNVCCSGRFVFCRPWPSKNSTCFLVRPQHTWHSDRETLRRAAGGPPGRRSTHAVDGPVKDGEHPMISRYF